MASEQRKPKEITSSPRQLPSIRGLAKSPTSTRTACARPNPRYLKPGPPVAVNTSTNIPTVAPVSDDSKKKVGLDVRPRRLACSRKVKPSELKKVEVKEKGKGSSSEDDQEEDECEDEKGCAAAGLEQPRPSSATTLQSTPAADSTAATQICDNQSCGPCDGMTIEEVEERVRSSVKELDLVAGANWVMGLLAGMDERKQWENEEQVERSMGRYVMFVELMIKHPGEFILPPDDVEMVWESHLIRPQMYREDWTKLVGHVVDHRIEAMQCMHAKAKANTERLWLQEFGQSMQSTELLSEGVELAIPAHLAERVRGLSMTAKDVIEDRNWFTYYNQYCAGVKETEGLIDRAHVGYIRFLAIVRIFGSRTELIFLKCAKHWRNSDFELEPNYPIDLLWHTHMIHPLAYARFCDALFGELLVHEPWPKELSQEKMRDNLDKVDGLWEKNFGQSIHDW